MFFFYGMNLDDSHKENVTDIIKKKMIEKNVCGVLLFSVGRLVVGLIVLQSVNPTEFTDTDSC